MKTLTGILYLALFCVVAMAQNPETSNMGQKPVAANMALQQHLKASAENNIWSAGNSKVKGSPYLDEEFSSGMIYWNGLQVVYLSLLGQQNGYVLYKHYLSSFTEAVTDTYADTDTDTNSDIYRKARHVEYHLEAPVYYVFRGNEHWAVKGSKSLAEMFQIDAKVVKSDLKEAVLYFSSTYISQDFLNIQL